MNDNSLGKIQLIIAIVAVVYVLMPDLFAGPVDDTAVAVIATIVETVLGVVRAISSRKIETFPNDFDES